MRYAAPAAALRAFEDDKAPSSYLEVDLAFRSHSDCLLFVGGGWEGTRIDERIRV